MEVGGRIRKEPGGGGVGWVASQPPRPQEDLQLAVLSASRAVVETSGLLVKLWQRVQWSTSLSPFVSIQQRQSRYPTKIFDYLYCYYYNRFIILFFTNNTYKANTRIFLLKYFVLLIRG